MQLEHLRIFLKINKQTFAKELGITQNTYTRYITGQRNIPTPIAVDIMRKWHISLSWLLGSVGAMKLTDIEINQLEISNGGE